MSSRTPHAHRRLCSLALILLSQAAVSAEPSQSLAEKRLGIIKGTTPGIVIIDFDKKPATAAPASTAATAATTAVDPKAPGATAAEQPIGNRLFSALPPPSGRSLQSARRLDAPDQGIALPTARTTSPAPVEPAAKP